MDMEDTWRNSDNMTYQEELKPYSTDCVNKHISQQVIALCIVCFW